MASPSRREQIEPLLGRIKQALDLVDVRTLDHIVVGAEGTTSFAERGFL